MKKEAKVEYGIQIVKPWSLEMYNHNEVVAEQVRSVVWDMWGSAVARCEQSIEIEDDASEVSWQCLEWSCASAEMVDIQKAVTCYGFASNYSIGYVSDEVLSELDEAPLFRLNEIVEELGIKLEPGFVGFK
jgi:hypothetical protein